MPGISLEHCRMKFHGSKSSTPIFIQRYKFIMFVCVWACKKFCIGTAAPHRGVLGLVGWLCVLKVMSAFGFLKGALIQIYLIKKSLVSRVEFFLLKYTWIRKNVSSKTTIGKVIYFKSICDQISIGEGRIQIPWVQIKFNKVYYGIIFLPSETRVASNSCMIVSLDNRCLLKSTDSFTASIGETTGIIIRSE